MRTPRETIRVKVALEHGGTGCQEKHVKARQTIARHDVDLDHKRVRFVRKREQSRTPSKRGQERILPVVAAAEVQKANLIFL